MKRFAFFYFMGSETDQIPRVIPHHVQHWDSHRSADYLGGPFADRSGGLIVFEADDLSVAEEAARGDPVMEEGLLSQWWLKEWSLQGTVNLS